MTAEFRFDGTKSFDQNFATFLDALDGIDGQMSAILRANAAALAAIVRDGDRHASARATFNSAIATALDVLAVPEPKQDGA